jgi:hypothetical protein
VSSPSRLSFWATSFAQHSSAWPILVAFEWVTTSPMNLRSRVCSCCHWLVSGIRITRMTLRRSSISFEAAAMGRQPHSFWRCLLIRSATSILSQTEGVRIPIDIGRARNTHAMLPIILRAVINIFSFGHNMWLALFLADESFHLMRMAWWGRILWAFRQKLMDVHASQVILCREGRSNHRN